MVLFIKCAKSILLFTLWCFIIRQTKKMPRKNFRNEIESFKRKQHQHLQVKPIIIEREFNNFRNFSLQTAKKQKKIYQNQ